MATVALWVRSYWVTDGVCVAVPQWGDPLASGDITFSSGRGGAYIHFLRKLEWRGDQRVPSRFADDPTLQYTRWPPHYPAQLVTRPVFRAAGFELAVYYRKTSALGESVQHSYIALIAPCWAASGATALLPAVWIWRTRKRRLSQAGVCPSCGYDMRATPHRCPECGVVTEARATGAA